MIQSPPKQVYEALARLEGDRDFTLVLDWLQMEHESILEGVELQQNDALLRQGQGAAQTLRTIISSAGSARKIASKHIR